MLQCSWYNVKLWDFFLQIPVVFEMLENYEKFDHIMCGQPRWLLGSVESGDQTCVTSINLGQKSPEQINKLQICVAWNASQCDVTWSWITITDQYWPLTMDNQPSQNRLTPGWPAHTCPRCLLRLMVTCEPVVRASSSWRSQTRFPSQEVTLFAGHSHSVINAQ